MASIFQAFNALGQSTHPEHSAKPDNADVLMKVFNDGREMSFWGDLHPSFAGNVVKAMGGTKQGYPVITKRLAQRSVTPVSADALIQKLNHELRPRVKEVVRLTPNIVEVVINAPIQARAFQPGQFYRLQNYANLAAEVEATQTAVEGLAMTGARHDSERGIISTIVLEMGGSSDLCATLKPNEPHCVNGAHRCSDRNTGRRDGIAGRRWAGQCSVVFYSKCLTRGGLTGILCGGLQVHDRSLSRRQY